MPVVRCGGGGSVGGGGSSVGGGGSGSVGNAGTSRKRESPVDERGGPCKKIKIDLGHGGKRLSLPPPPPPKLSVPSTRLVFPAYIDNRFFPNGLMMGHIVEVKGPQFSGKSHLLLYFLARMLRLFPTKKVVFVDTSHQFNWTRFIDLLCFNQPWRKPRPAPVMTLDQVVELMPELKMYLDRLIGIPCYTVNDFLRRVVYTESSILQRLIQHDPDIALILIDTVDQFTFTDSQPRDAKIDVLGGIRTNSMRVPIIWTTVNIPRSWSLGYSADNVTSTGRININSLHPIVDFEKDHRDLVASMQNLTIHEGNDGPMLAQDNNNVSVPFKYECLWFANLHYTDSVMTHKLTVTPIYDVKEKEKLARPPRFRHAHLAKAELRSIKNPWTVLSSQRFSIFSDMLWIVPD